MLSKRVIPCLDVRAGRLTKGIKFQGNVDIGDPVESARRYYEEGADEIVIQGGRRRMGIDAIEWARQCQELGAGELCVNSIDADGTRDGYELTLTRAIVDAVSIPVIASGGAGAPEHMYDAVSKGGASAALIASIVHYGQYTIRQCKEVMAEKGAKVRLTW